MTPTKVNPHRLAVAAAVKEVPPAAAPSAAASTSDAPVEKTLADTYGATAHISIRSKRHPTTKGVLVLTAVLSCRKSNLPINVVLGSKAMKEGTSQPMQDKIEMAMHKEATNKAIAIDLQEEDNEFYGVLLRLKYLAEGMSRALKFQLDPTLVKTPGAAGAAAPGKPPVPPKTAWKCKVSVKDEWGMLNKYVPHRAATAASPLTSFRAIVGAMAKEYEAEAKHSNQALEDVLELERYLECKTGKSITKSISMHDPSNIDSVESTIAIGDKYGNSTEFRSGKKATTYAGYRACAAQAYKQELADGADAFFASKLLWNVDKLTDDLFGRELATSHDSAPLPPEEHFLSPPEFESGLKYRVTRVGKNYRANITYRDHNFLSPAESSRLIPGVYRLQLETFVSALKYLLREQEMKNPRKIPGPGEWCPFKAAGTLLGTPSNREYETSVQVDQAFTELKSISVIPAVVSKNTKITPFTVLGSLTGKHFGEPYRVEYTSRTTALAGGGDANHCEVLVKDKVLGGASHHSKGESFKLACAHTIEKNFPEAWEQVKDRPDFDGLSVTAPAPAPNTSHAQAGAKKNATMHSKSTKLKLAQFQTLLQLLQALGKETEGWNELAIECTQIAQNHANHQWMAQSTVKTKERPQEWQILVQSPPVQTKTRARRFATYMTAAKFFPKELEAYLSAGRQDPGTPEELEMFKLQNVQVYDQNTSFLAQILNSFLDSNTALQGQPLWVNLKLHTPLPNHQKSTGSGDQQELVELCSPFAPRYKASLVEQLTGKVLVERLGEAEDSILEVLRLLLTKDLQVVFKGSNLASVHKLWMEFESIGKDSYTLAKDLSHFLLVSLFGSKNIEVDSRSVKVDGSSTVWVSTVQAKEYGNLPIGRGYGVHKKEAVLSATYAATREHFPIHLDHAAKKSARLAEMVSDIRNYRLDDYKHFFGKTTIGSGRGSMDPWTSAKLEPKSSTQLEEQQGSSFVDAIWDPDALPPPPPPPTPPLNLVKPPPPPPPVPRTKGVLPPAPSALPKTTSRASRKAVVLPAAVPPPPPPPPMADGTVPLPPAAMSGSKDEESIYKSFDDDEFDAQGTGGAAGGSEEDPFAPVQSVFEEQGEAPSDDSSWGETMEGGSQPTESSGSWSTEQEPATGEPSAADVQKLRNTTLESKPDLQVTIEDLRLGDTMPHLVIKSLVSHFNPAYKVNHKNEMLPDGRCRTTLYSCKIVVGRAQVLTLKGEKTEEPEVISVADGKSKKEALQLASIDAISMWFPTESMALRAVNQYFAPGYDFGH